VQDVRVHKSEDLTRKMLRQLGDEDQPQPSFPTALRDPRNLLEESPRLLDALGAQELVGFLDDDERPRGRRDVENCRPVLRLARFLQC
jgi:hypothetical protein